MIDLREFFDESPDHPRGHGEGIASAQQDVVDLGMFPDVSDGVGEPADGFLRRKADEPLPEAVPAESGALVGRQDQRGLRVLVLKAGQFRVLLLSALVVYPGAVELAFRRNSHLSEGIIRVVPVDKRSVIPRDAHRMPADDLPQFLFLGTGHIYELGQIFQRCDIIPEFGFP